MAIDTKNRSELKAYFVKNAIPTESNFSDLIDGQLNQADDGVFKLGDEPLSVVAAPGDQKRVLRLYENYPAQQPSWTVSLMPRTNPGNKNTAARGLGFDAPDGSNRLFLAADGKLGVGTTKPTDKLTVHGGDVRIEGGNYRRLKVVSDTYWAGIEIVARNTDGKGGRPHIDFTHGDLDNPNFGLRLSATSNTQLMLEGGSLGVGVNPSKALDVNGEALVRNNLQANKALYVKEGLIHNGQRGGHENTDGSYYRKGNQVYMTLADWLLLRKPNDGDTWGIALGSNGELRTKQGLSVGEGNRSNHMDYDGAWYRKGNENWMTVDGWVYYRKPKDGDNWGLRIHNNGHVETKNCFHFGAGDRGSHIDADGVLYRKAGQAWLTVDDNFYIRDSGQKNDERKFHFDTNNGNLHASRGLYCGTVVGIGNWRIVEDGNHLIFKRGNLTIMRLSIDHDRIQFYQDRNYKAPYWYFNSKGSTGRHKG
ncbi:hypothetical protein PPSIR1_25261 [Plesiocystis pacifica SIR-1]|uniref:Uncharacterized protein n=1 Tax=Plesiocystis pacifica SIR-1 TaxID=391625 RepID=A6FZ66_9BACT|nr:hypothetical protein [Plesiocystis pacifica]EDM80950.1 hypothetical protein PPSIR1_25261 [Plesiocystis pacifica SIR-1]